MTHPGRKPASAAPMRRTSPRLRERAATRTSASLRAGAGSSTSRSVRRPVAAGSTSTAFTSVGAGRLKAGVDLGFHLPEGVGGGHLADEDLVVEDGGTRTDQRVLIQVRADRVGARVVRGLDDGLVVEAGGAAARPIVEPRLVSASVGAARAPVVGDLLLRVLGGEDVEPLPHPFRLFRAAHHGEAVAVVDARALGLAGAE